MFGFWKKNDGASFTHQTMKKTVLNNFIKHQLQATIVIQNANRTSTNSPNEAFTELYLLKHIIWDRYISTTPGGIRVFSSFRKITIVSLLIRPYIY